MKKATSIIIYTIIIILVFGFHPGREEVTDIHESSEKRGNTAGNIVNRGFAAMADDWIYFSDGSGLFKVKKDDKSRIKISDDKASYLNISGNYLYFSSYMNGSTKLFRIKTDGTGRQKLSDNNCSYINVAEDFIYYISRIYDDNTAAPGLYMIEANGRNEKRLVSGRVSNAVAQGSFIYYTDNSKLYRIKNDGTGRMLLSRDHVTDMAISDGWIYYNTPTFRGDWEFYKIKPDGSKKTKIATNIGSFNICGEWIYYSLSHKSSNSKSLYRMKTDGTNNARIVDDIASDINILDGFIYYFDYQDKKLYRIKPDGMGRESL